MSAGTLYTIYSILLSSVSAPVIHKYSMADSTVKMSKSERKFRKKQSKMHHSIFKHDGIKISQHPTPHLVIGNGGLDNGVTREALLSAFSRFGIIHHILMQPRKPYSFVTYSCVKESNEAIAALNGHTITVDKDIILYISHVENVPGFQVPASVLPPGLVFVPDFVSEQEEQCLLDCVDWNRGENDLLEASNQTLKHRRVKHYGYEFLYGINNVMANKPLESTIPPACDTVLDELINKGYFTMKPDQLTVNQYEPGQGIPPHIDTHSAFKESIASLSLGSQAVMDFTDPDDNCVSVLLPRRSLLIMADAARYKWKHAIVPRKFDIVSLPHCDSDLTLIKRGVRTSFTFRLLRREPCKCDFPEQCDSQKTATKENAACVPNSIEEAKELEAEYVHKVYDEIACHFSATRHSPWPQVVDFLKSLPYGSLIADVGCGNGKYLANNEHLIKIGSDRSPALCKISKERGFSVFVCDCLAIPLREGLFDAAVSIAVIHHLSTPERRETAIRELIKLLKVGGKGLIYVWAMEQERNEELSNYIKESKEASTKVELAEQANSMKGSKSHCSDKDISEACAIAEKPMLSTSASDKKIDESCRASLDVHVNRTRFKSRDMLVPWHLREKSSYEEGDGKNVKSTSVFHRYYHLFTEGDLDSLCDGINGVSVKSSYYDKGNWCVVIEKI